MQNLHFQRSLSDTKVRICAIFFFFKFKLKCRIFITNFLNICFIIKSSLVNVKLQSTTGKTLVGALKLNFRETQSHDITKKNIKTYEPEYDFAELYSGQNGTYYDLEHFLEMLVL